MAIAGAVTRDDQSRSESDHGGRSRDRAPGAGESQPRSRRRPGCVRAVAGGGCPGERVQIVVEHGLDKRALFRAMAGLSLWGAGTIHLPPRGTMMFRPPRPYLPLGTLRAGASYPAAPERFDHASVAAALERVGHLLLALDREERWDKDLPQEQQRLAFARLVLHRPRWVILDDALSALDEDHAGPCWRPSTSCHTAVVIGAPAPNGLYDRTLHFRRSRRAPPLCPFAPAHVRHGPAPWLGNMTAQMRNCLDRAGMLWAHDSSSERFEWVFGPSATQHGGQEFDCADVFTPLALIAAEFELRRGSVANAGIHASCSVRMICAQLLDGSPAPRSISGSVALRLGPAQGCVHKDRVAVRRAPGRRPAIM